MKIVILTWCKALGNLKDFLLKTACVKLVTSYYSDYFRVNMLLYTIVTLT